METLYSEQDRRLQLSTPSALLAQLEGQLIDRFYQCNPLVLVANCDGLVDSSFDQRYLKSVA